MIDSQVQIFLAYAHEDKKFVFKIHKLLKKAGYKPWLDKIDLIPGQNWREEIPKAIAASDIFIACLSEQSVNKSGFIQREFRLALNYFAEKPPGTIYLIPLKLDECEVPDLRREDYGLNFRDIQWIDYYTQNGSKILLKTIEYRVISSKKKDRISDLYLKSSSKINLSREFILEKIKYFLVPIKNLIGISIFCFSISFVSAINFHSIWFTMILWPIFITCFYNYENKIEDHKKLKEILFQCLIVPFPFAIWAFIFGFIWAFILGIIRGNINHNLIETPLDWGKNSYFYSVGLSLYLIIYYFSNRLNATNQKELPSGVFFILVSIASGISILLGRFLVSIILLNRPDLL